MPQLLKVIGCGWAITKIYLAPNRWLRYGTTCRLKGVAKGATGSTDGRAASRTMQGIERLT
jgi:hypothetical protein